MILFGKPFPRPSGRGRLRAALLLGLATGLAGVAAARAECVQLAWDPSPEPAVEGYIVFYGEFGGVTNQVRTGIITNSPLCGLRSGGGYWAQIVAVDHFGNQSIPSNLITFSAGVDLAVFPGAGEPEASNSERRMVPHLLIEPCHGSIHVLAETLVNQKVGLEASSDLKTWKKLGVLSSSTGYIEFIELPDRDAPVRFYRVITAPDPSLPPDPTVEPSLIGFK